jgi:hypothetical protein
VQLELQRARRQLVASARSEAWRASPPVLARMSTGAHHVVLLPSGALVLAPSSIDAMAAFLKMREVLAPFRLKHEVRCLV